MIQTVVTPLKEDFDMSVSLPADYVGKKVHVLFYTDEEVTKTTALVVPPRKPSDYFGILSKEEGDKMNRHIQQMRGEWDRGI